MHRGQIHKVEQCCFHVTHRCQERRFLLKIEIDRVNSVKRLCVVAAKYNIDILDYMVTNNHVHLLLWTNDPDWDISGITSIIAKWKILNHKIWLWYNSVWS